jgi:hypothetical protein
LFLPYLVVQSHLHISQCELLVLLLEVFNPFKSSLVRYSLYNLNRISNKQHLCPTTIPIFTRLVSLWLSHILTL